MRKRPRRPGALAGDAAQVVVEPFGDIWLRDTAAIVTGDGDARDFRFNGWGGKYDLPGDDDIGLRLAERRHIKAESCDWILEGGAIDGDGTGLVVTTEQCLLNPQPQPRPVARRDRGAAGGRTSAIREVIWLGDGLMHDHTDGHVDNLAALRGAWRNRLLIPEPAENDPNWRVYQNAARDAERARRRDRPLPLARPGAARRRDHPRQLHELLYRQRRGGRPALWRRPTMRPRSRRSRRCSRTATSSASARTRSPDRRRQLPLRSASRSRPEPTGPAFAPARL